MATTWPVRSPGPRRRDGAPAAGQGDRLAGAVPELQAQERRAVAPPAQLGRAHEQDLVDVVSFLQIAHEHGEDRREGRGRHRLNDHVLRVAGAGADLTMDATVVVTGGTGGLGAAVTHTLLDGGWRVVVPWYA